MRILFIVGRSFEQIGGHKLSAIHLARTLSKQGHQVGLLGNMDPSNLEIKGAEESGVKLHYVPFVSVIKSYLQRPKVILRTTREFQYEVLVCMDNPATLQAGLAYLFSGLPVVQVIAGGPVSIRPVLNIPGIVVFSKELLYGIPRKYNLPLGNFILSEGRVDFNQFSTISDSQFDGVERSTEHSSKRILFISRLDTQDKANAFLKFFPQVDFASKKYKIVLKIIGDGPYRPLVEDAVAQMISSDVSVTFLGERRVDEKNLKVSDLVIGQGRTVIESIASYVPASVCSSEGYFGLLSLSLINQLAETNLTGRGLIASGNLLSDLDNLNDYIQSELILVYRFAKEKYCADEGAKKIVEAAEQILVRHPKSTKRQILYSLNYLMGASRFLIGHILDWITR